MKNVLRKENLLEESFYLGISEDYHFMDNDRKYYTLKKEHPRMWMFFLAEKERFELSRRFHDLHP